jgi:hypothetical protein
MATTTLEQDVEILAQPEAAAELGLNTKKGVGSSVSRRKKTADSRLWIATIIRGKIDL